MTTSYCTLESFGWPRECQFKGPSAPEALNGGAVVLGAGHPDRLCESHRLAAKHHDEIVALVVALLGVRRPAAIALRVGAVIVWETIQAHSWRAVTHVREEALETLAPLRGHHNSARAVPREMVVSGLSRAAFLGAAPCLIGGALTAMSSVSVRAVLQGLFNSHFASQTAAAFRVAAAQVVTGDGENVSARAFARPRDSRVFLRSLSHDS